MPVPYNADCTRENRCGHCRKDVLAAANRRNQDARHADATRQCVDCHEVKATDDFRYQHRPGTYLWGQRCAPCRLEHIRQLVKGNRPDAQEKVPVGKTPRIRRKRSCRKAPCPNLVTKVGQQCWACYGAERERSKAKKLVVAAVHAEPKNPCTGNCGTLLTKKNQRCNDCRRRNQALQAAQSQDRMHKAQIQRLLDNGRPVTVDEYMALPVIATCKSDTRCGGCRRDVQPVMWITKDEAWALNCRCPANGCGRPVLVRTVCYKCSTGKERKILRPEERVEPIVPAIPMDMAAA